MDTIFGIPAHPLLVHIPVVLVPLSVALVLLGLVLPRARSIVVPAALALAGAAALGTFLVQESGEPLEERVEDARVENDLIEEHTEEGERVLPFVAAFAVITAGAAAAGRSESARRAVVPVLAVALLAGAAATYQVTVVGHSGARAAWDDVTATGD